MISIVDYGVVNLGSIRNMFRKLGYETTLVSTPAGIEAATKLLLPGVGAFDHGMSALTELGLVDALQSKALQDGTPLLGICLGMQMLGEGSDEGSWEGLGIIRGRSVRFELPEGSTLKIPHMGWNIPRIRASSPLVEGLDPKARFYFLHSYHFVCVDPGDVLATADHGVEFTAMIQHGNVMGTQFHPEKSHRFGMAILRNFGDL